MAVRTGLLRLETRGGGELVDVTPAVVGVLRTMDAAEGIACVFATGPTAAVTTLALGAGGGEGLHARLGRVIAAGVGEDPAHARECAAIVGQSVCVPLSGGRPSLGPAQIIALIDFGAGPAGCDVHVQIVS